MARNMSGSSDCPPLVFIDLQAQRQRIGSRIEDAIAKVLEHGQFIMGPEVPELEKALSDYCGASHVVSCASGTDALVLVLLAWKIGLEGNGRQDAVLVPGFTFAATAEAVALVGATPVFCDVCPETFNLDPDSVESGLRRARELGLTPKAIIAADLFGQPADYKALRSIADREGLKLLADAAQSFGSDQDGKKTGTLADATTTSFFPAKPLGCYGDGGAVMTDDPDCASVLRSLRVHGKGGHKYDNVRIGINGRLDTLQAAILLEKLRIFDDELQARRTVANYYKTGLQQAGLTGKGWGLPVEKEGMHSVWAQFTLTLPDEPVSNTRETEPGQRDQLVAFLKASEIPSAIYYPLPVHLQTAYEAFPVAAKAEGRSLPVCEKLSRQVISLPMHPYLRAEQQQHVMDVLLEWCNSR